MASPIVTCGGATVRDTHGSYVSHGLRQPEVCSGAEGSRPHRARACMLSTWVVTASCAERIA
eukprot:scaffold141944_cov133-Phaeocystis_antarctica.AAC.1